MSAFISPLLHWVKQIILIGLSQQLLGSNVTLDQTMLVTLHWFKCYTGSGYACYSGCCCSERMGWAQLWEVRASDWGWKHRHNKSQVFTNFPRCFLSYWAGIIYMTRSTPVFVVKWNKLVVSSSRIRLDLLLLWSLWVPEIQSRVFEWYLIFRQRHMKNIKLISPVLNRGRMLGSS